MLSVTVHDETQVERVIAALEAHHPVDIDEDGARGKADHPPYYRRLVLRQAAMSSRRKRLPHRARPARIPASILLLLFRRKQHLQTWRQRRPE